MIAPLPVNEAKRLQTLRSYHILDTAPEDAFECLSSLAARVFNVPIALVSLVDEDRQWFKACFGVDMRETSRELSFCAYAILSDEVMVVQDATTDSRFIDNALVTGSPHIRFYAGAPLKTSDGSSLGSFCVLDTTPREFSPVQQEMLSDLAKLVVDQMELRRTARAHRELAVAVDNLISGVILLDASLPDKPITYANPSFCVMTGYKAEEIINRNCDFIYGPETDPATLQAINDAIAEHRTFKTVTTTYRKNGTAFLNELVINPVLDETGTLISVVKLQSDITERVQAEEALRQAKIATENINRALEKRVRERTKELADSQIEILNRLSQAAEYRDDDTGQHTQRVAHTSALLAGVLGWAPEQVTLMRQAAPLHDLGKIGISDLILLKPGKLTNEEFDIMKQHAPIGARMLSNGHSPVVQLAESIAGSHHERWDGKGYPQQLAAEAIPLEGRILAVADVFDALTHDRPYKTAWPVAEAVAEIILQSGKQFDPQVVEAFLQLPHEDLVTY